MREVYPIILTQGETMIVVYVPDFQINTEGTDFADAMAMARDAICAVAVDMLDSGEPLPRASGLADIHPEADEVVTLVDVDIEAYRKRHNQRTVRRNISLPQWLDEAATEAGINVSALTQKAIKEELQIA